MESNQEQKKVSSENYQGQSAHSLSKRMKTRQRLKRHRALAAASVYAQQQKKQKNKASEKPSDVSQDPKNAKADEKGQPNLQQREKAASSDAQTKKEKAAKQLSRNQGKSLKNQAKGGQQEEKKEKEGKNAPKSNAVREQAEQSKKSAKKEKNKKETNQQALSQTEQPKEEKEPSKQKKRRKRHGITFYVFIVTLFVVIGSAAAVASLFLTSNNSFFANIPEVELPVFTKMNVDDILENPEYANFRFRIEEIYSNEAEEGIVTDQSPKPPKSVKENAVITLKVSKGPENITVPSVVGWNRDTAREKFKDLGLSVLIQSESDRNVAPNKVIRTNPEAGTVVQAGDVITVYVSRSISESTIVTIPDCVGMMQDSAKNQLSRLGLVGLTVIKDGSEPAGTVIEQSPAGGTKTGANDTVQLYVSNGKLAGDGTVTGGVPAQEGQQLYPGGPTVGNADGQVVPGSVTGHIHTWQTISGTGSQVCAVCGQTR